jgi:hypothetical protein
MLQKKKMMIMCRRLFLWSYCIEKGDSSKLASPFSLCLKRKRRRWCSNAFSFSSMAVFHQRRKQQFVTIAFFFGGVEAKKTMVA